MSRTNLIYMTLGLCACLVLTGCMPKMTIEEMKAEMPKRPVELDRLDAFVGTWEYSGEMTFAMLDEPLKVTGTSEGKWDGNRWFLVNRSVMNMEHFDQSVALETWTYDIKTKKYRSNCVDSMGMIGSGVSSYDEKTDTWKMKATSYGPWGKSSMKGWFKFTSADTMEWWFAVYQDLMQTMEMSGTGRRQP